jgi:predicted metal-dependent phosphoesterase TrpH
VRIRGALHVHSTFSHDGTLTIAELGRLYARRGFQFIAIGEHSQDMDAEKVRELVEQSPSASNAGLLIVSGIEFTCSTPGMHILGVGARDVAPDADPLTAARIIREHGGFAVLAHPGRFGWSCPAELLAEIKAVEI